MPVSREMKLEQDRDELVARVDEQEKELEHLRERLVRTQESRSRLLIAVRQNKKTRGTLEDACDEKQESADRAWAANENLKYRLRLLEADVRDADSVAIDAGYVMELLYAFFRPGPAHRGNPIELLAMMRRALVRVVGSPYRAERMRECHQANGTRPLFSRVDS